ncbi:MAG: ABC transporter substrate-binding protein [Pseudomonadota bacterium]|nr:ABC transporter substrate-binding protein [Pseudomonadota bacterium]
MPRKSWVGLSIALGIFLTIVLSIAKQPAEMVKNRPAAISVGVILPLTGPVAGPGKNALHGLELAISNFNAGSPDHTVRLMVEDSQSDPKAGVSAAKKLIAVDHVRIIIGDLMSSVAMAIAPVTEKNNVVLFAPGASNPKFPELGNHLFRNWASDDYDGKVMADYLLKEFKLKKGGVVYVNNEYGLGLAEAFKNRYQSGGGNVLLYEGYDQGSVDFRPIIGKLKAMRNLEFVYLPGQPVENGHLVKQLVEGGVTLVVSANLSVDSPEFSAIVGQSAKNIIFTTPAYDPEASNTKAFRESYQRAYKALPDVVAGHGYDAGNILIQALRTCNFDLSEIRNCLAGIKDFPGVTGETTFLPNGDVKKDVLVKQLVGPNDAKVLRKYSVER